MNKEDKDDLLVNIQNSLPGLSKSHRLIGKYILDNYDKAAFSTASKLADRKSVV